MHCWSCTCSGFFQLVLSGMRLFLTARAPGSTGILSGPGKWGWCFTTLIFQGSLKPHWGGFGAFEGKTNLLVHSTLPQLGIYNPACPERFGFWVTKYSVVLTVSYKSQWCNECPDSLQGVFTGLEQNSWSYRNRSISFLVSTRNF